MSEQLSNEPIDILVSSHQPETVSIKSYVIGFVGSLVLTITAYLFTRYDVLHRPIMIALLAALALSQFVLQLVFFLHVGREFSPRLKLLVTVLMIIVVVILVAGSIWIMTSLNNHMTVKQMIQYMNNQGGL